MAGLQRRTSRPPAGVLQCDHPVLPDGEGAFWAATPANNWDVGVHPGDGKARLACAGLLYTEPKAEDFGCANHLPPRAGAAELAGG